MHWAEEKIKKILSKFRENNNFCDILMMMQNASILAKIKVENCSKKSLIFSSAVYNHIMFCITKQRKVEKNQKQKFKLELKIVKKSAWH